MTILYVVFGLVGVLLVWVIATYNSLVVTRNRVDEAWSDIDVQLKRRYDLIPNLVEAVKGYAAHESGAFEAVTEARAKALGAQSVHEKEVADLAVTGALRGLFAVAEAYPQLRAVESFTRLQDELSDTENKIQAARRFYNGNVRDFNTYLESFPANTIAGMLGFKKREFFELENSVEREPVSVKF